LPFVIAAAGSAMGDRPMVPLPYPVVPPGGVDPLAEQLLVRRTLLVSGALDGDAVGLLSVRLMALDGMSGADVELVVNSGGGPLAEIFAVIDVIDLMRATVNVTCIGTAASTAAALVACCGGQRRAAPHATFVLRGEPERFEGSTTDIAHQARELSELRSRYTRRLSAATGRDEQTISATMESGRRLNSQEAAAFGIVDVIASRSVNADR
jgi:ATP-dependent Clp protease, protease subunit